MVLRDYSLRSAGDVILPLSLRPASCLIIIIIIRDTLLNWLVKFFTGRSHCTKIGTAMSDFAVLLSGVVQGSGIVSK